MLDLSEISSIVLAALFFLCAGIIAFAGVKLTYSAEQIARLSGLGQALTGAIFLGVSTSISGSILSFYTASQDRPALAVSNAIGGIAAQTAFLVIADFTYKRANLEHSASSLNNLMQATLLMMLLAIPILGFAMPDWTVFAIHPVSLVLVLAYGAGLIVIRRAKAQPMWKPQTTRETQDENKPSTSEPDISESLRKNIFIFALLALMLGVTGIGLAEVAIEISDRSGLSDTAIGGLLTSITTSLPELITAITAVQRGALNLAVGDIIGGNSFDVLFLAGSDVFFREGSIYHQLDNTHLVLFSTTIIMSGVLLLGLMRRQEGGPANVGFESLTILLIYGVFVAYMLISP